MASENTHTFTFQGVPDVARPVIITAEENTPGDGE